MKDNALIIEVIKGHEAPRERTFKNKDSGQETKIFEQDHYIHNGYPVPTRVTQGFQNLSDCLVAGKYNLSPKSFKASKFGKIELDSYNLEYIRIDG